MSELWNVRAEIMVQPEDFASGDTLGFMNIITWADSAETAQEKIGTLFQIVRLAYCWREEAKVLDVDLRRGRISGDDRACECQS